MLPCLVVGQTLAAGLRSESVPEGAVGRVALYRAVGRICDKVGGAKAVRPGLLAAG